MSASLKISVIIPTFNRRVALQRAIESVFAQTLLPLEILVIDDGSTDATEAWVASLRNPLVCYFQQPENQGAAAARNRGILEAKGDWIAFLDSDDFWFPHKLENQIQFISSLAENQTMICFHRVIVQDEINNEARPFRGLLANEKVGDYLFRHGGIIQTSSLLGRKQIFQRISFDPLLPRHQDWDLCLRLEAVGISFVYLPETLGVWMCEKRADRISIQKNSDYSQAWLDARSHLISKAAAEAFTAEIISPSLYEKGKRITALAQITKAALKGFISLKTLFRLYVFLLFPKSFYDYLTKIASKQRPSTT